MNILVIFEIDDWWWLNEMNRRKWGICHGRQRRVRRMINAMLQNFLHNIVDANGDLLPNNNLKYQRMMNHHIMHCLNAVNCHQNAQLNCNLTTFALTIITTCWSLCKGNKSFLSRGTTSELRFKNLSAEPLKLAIDFCASLCNFRLKLHSDGSDSNFRHGKKSKDKSLYLKNYKIVWTTTASIL